MRLWNRDNLVLGHSAVKGGMYGTVLFGAGASYGSQKHGQPPLGNALFPALQAFSPSLWGALPNNFSEIFKNNFEAGMQKIAAENGHAIAPLQRAMADFFFSFHPTTDSLYISLAKRLCRKQWLGTLASLNYERLLEISLKYMSLEPRFDRGPSSLDHIDICMPHGCSNLFCEGVFGAASSVSMHGQNVRTNGPVTWISDVTQFKNKISTDAFPPVMSYFEPSKTTTSGANFIENQRLRWVELCEISSHIAIIGVHPRSYDEHIWGPLAKSKAKVLYCSGPDGAEAYQKWALSVSRPNHDQVVKAFFNDEFDRICDFIGL